LREYPEDEAGMVNAVAKPPKSAILALAALGLDSTENS
jgi:hypothetical protein